MNFKVDEERKLHWNDDWVKRGRRGKVLIAAGIALMVIGAVLVVRATTSDAWGTNFAEDPIEDALVAVAWALGVVFVIVGIAFVFVVPRMMRKDQLKLSDETLIIQGEYLTICYHRNDDVDTSGRDVHRVWLPSCVWHYDTAGGKLMIRGAVRDGHFNALSETMPDWGLMRPVDSCVFYPYYYVSDGTWLVDALTRLGVPQTQDRKWRKAQPDPEQEDFVLASLRAAQADWGVK